MQEDPDLVLNREVLEEEEVIEEVIEEVLEEEVIEEVLEEVLEEEFLEEVLEEVLEEDNSIILFKVIFNYIFYEDIII